MFNGVLLILKSWKTKPRKPWIMFLEKDEMWTSRYYFLNWIRCFLSQLHLSTNHPTMNAWNINNSRRIYKFYIILLLLPISSRSFVNIVLRGVGEIKQTQQRPALLLKLYGWSLFDKRVSSSVVFFCIAVGPTLLRLGIEEWLIKTLMNYI